MVALSIVQIFIVNAIIFTVKLVKYKVGIS